MAATFVQSQRAADRLLDQAEKQVATAGRLNIDLGISVANQQVTRSETLYGQVNTYLGLASTSLSNARLEISDAARQASVPEELQSVQALAARANVIDNQIGSIRNSSTASITALRREQYDRENNTPVPAANSAGEEVVSQQAANADDSLVQNPPLPQQTLEADGSRQPADPGFSPDSNARRPELADNQDLGLVDGSSTVGGARPTVPVSRTNGSTVSPSDDNVNVAATDQEGGITADGRPPIAPEFLSKIVSTPNPLAQLASMTYSISIYLTNRSEYIRLLLEQNKTLPTQQLLIQSGGIDQGVGSGINERTGTNIGQRNPFFDVDFYIDDLQIESTVGTQGGSRSHNAVNLSFTVIEPNGITFIERLRRAVKEHYRDAGPTLSEAQAYYLMVIRFYGYDSQGNQVSGSQVGAREVGSDPRAIVEKFIPFQIQNIRYRIGAKNVEYRVAATTPAVNVAFSTATATIPFDFELMAPDVQTLLNGKAVLGTSTQPPSDDAENRDRNAAAGAPPKASDLSQRKVYTQGLCDALNRHQLELKASGEQSEADVYEIVLENIPGLVDAKMAKPGSQDIGRAAMTVGATAAEKLLPGRSRYDKETKRWSITRGTQIVQLIDLVMRNSSYIYSQQNIIFDEKTLAPRAQSPVKTVQWFRIRSRVVPLRWDNKRNTYSHKITYTVTRYQINDPRIPVFPDSIYRGTHKLYNWIFTGQNSEILDYEIDAYYNYITTFGSAQGLTVNPNPSSGRIAEKRFFQNKPNAESTGGQGNVNSPAANLSERLYTDSDIQRANLMIVGDPDWLIQNEVYYNQGARLSPFMPDGSVNYDASEVLFEVRFNPAYDYDASIGLSPAYQYNVPFSPVTGERNIPQQSAVYAAQTVTSDFSKGKFTQKLVGTIKGFYPQTANLTELEKAKLAAQGPVRAPSDAGLDTAQSTQSQVRVIDNAVAAATSTNATPAPAFTTTRPAAVQSITADQPGRLSTSATPPKVGSTVPSDDAAEPVNIVAP